jgi:hypothetical protein
MMRSRTAWDDHYPPANPTTYISQTYSSRQSVSGSLYFSNCLFRSITTSSDGGALSVSGSTLLIESTSFFSCTTSNTWGGALYSYSGQSVLYKVCGYNCYSTSNSNSYGQFLHIGGNSTTLGKNFLNYSSFTRSLNDRSGARYMLFYYSGKFGISQANVSNNRCQLHSGIYYRPVADPNIVTCSFSFTTFADNTANGYNCIMLNVAGTFYEIKCCNIIRNTQGSINSEGTFTIYGNLTIEDSCILENTATNTFYTFSTCIITLSHCTIDKTAINSGSLTIQNTPEKSFILALDHMSTQNCYSKYDSVGALTATPFVSHSPKVICYNYTCRKNNYKTIIRDFISLISMFVVTFVHSYPLGDY